MSTEPSTWSPSTFHFNYLFRYLVPSTVHDSSNQNTVLDRRSKFLKSSIQTPGNLSSSNWSKYPFVHLTPSSCSDTCAPIPVHDSRSHNTVFDQRSKFHKTSIQTSSNLSSRNRSKYPFVPTRSHLPGQHLQVSKYLVTPTWSQLPGQHQHINHNPIM